MVLDNREQTKNNVVINQFTMPFGSVQDSQTDHKPTGKGAAALRPYLFEASFGKAQKADARQLTRVYLVVGKAGSVQLSGSIHAPPTAISQWRCGPVLRPVLPLNPMGCPASSNWPGFTVISERWQ